MSKSSDEKKNSQWKLGNISSSAKIGDLTARQFLDLLEDNLLGIFLGYQLRISQMDIMVDLRKEIEKLTSSNQFPQHDQIADVVRKAQKAIISQISQQA